MVEVEGSRKVERMFGVGQQVVRVSYKEVLESLDRTKVGG